MPPPQKWYLTVEDKRIYLHMGCQEGGSSNGKENGAVKELQLYKNAGRQTLRFKFSEGVPQDFYVQSFDWSMSQFSTFFNAKGIRDEAGFYDVWSKFVAPSLDATTGEYSITYPEDEQEVETTVAALKTSSGQGKVQSPTAVPNIPKRKRSRNEGRTPTIRPTKVVRKDPLATSVSNRIKNDLDSGIEKAFIGHFTLPVSCLIEPPAPRLLRPVDDLFVENLKAAMKSNPSKDVAPIVGLVVLPDGQQFQECQMESYEYETLGGNNSRAALQALLQEDDKSIFKTRLVSVYQGLSDEEALRLAAKHNMATALHHDMTTWEKVRMCRTLLYNLASCNEDNDTPEKPKNWRSHCSTILMQPVRVLDDACVYYLASLPKPTFSVIEKVFELYSRGEIKGQTVKKGTLGKKMDLKGSKFKHVRGLDSDIVHELLSEVAKQESSIHELIAECHRIKQLRDVQEAFVKQTGMSSWKEAEEQFPEFATAAAMDEFITSKISGKFTNARFKDFCQLALRGKETASRSQLHDCFHYNGSAAVLATGSGTALLYQKLTEVCTSNQQNFTGAALAIVDTAGLQGEIPQSLAMVMRGIRALNTTAGLQSYTIAVIGKVNEMTTISNTFTGCGLSLQETVFIHKEGCTEPSAVPSLYKSVQPVILGVSEGVPAVESRIGNLITSKKEAILQDDAGTSMRADFDEGVYHILVNLFSKQGQWVLLLSTITGEGPMAAIKSNRNAIALCISEQELQLIKRDMNKKLSEEL